MKGGDDKPKDIYWSFYIPFIEGIVESEHFETYCHYISQSGSEVSKLWLAEIPEKLDNFSRWLQN